MAFITGRTNRRLSNKPPEDYFQDIIDRRGAEALHGQRVPMEQDLWKIETYREFLNRRRELIANAINQLIERAFQSGSVSVPEGTTITRRTRVHA